MSVHFSSASDAWATPPAFFARLSERFGPFDLDPCATPENAKASLYYTREDDGLSQSWRGRVFMNPPYGRSIGKWMRKAHESARNGATVVCLVPARTDTAWWHDYAMLGEIEFVRGRLKFGDSGKDAPFPCAIVVFRPASGILTEGGDAKQAPGASLSSPAPKGDAQHG
jgi:phage N-6-adenine-methyltransferase